MTELDVMPGDPPRAMWFDLPTGARDWVSKGGRYSFYLPKILSAHDLAAGRERLAEWDQLVGRMIRASLFDPMGEPRVLRQLAEAVAAVAEQLAVALDEHRP